MARRNRDPEREAKREKMSSLLQELKVSSMEDIHDLFKEMIGTFLEEDRWGQTYTFYKMWIIRRFRTGAT